MSVLKVILKLNLGLAISGYPSKFACEITTRLTKVL